MTQKSTDTYGTEGICPTLGGVMSGSPELHEHLEDAKKTRRVLVMLPAHLDTTNFHEQFLAGLKADRSPWGLGWAADFGFSVQYSAATLPRGVRGFVQRAIRTLVGADLVHGWMNRRAINGADVILTHMEREWVAAAFAIKRSADHPRLIANTIWLPGEWSERNPGWRWAVGRARRKVACFTFNAKPAMDAFQKRFGQGAVCRYVAFGVSWESFTPATSEPDPDRPILVAGDDRYRDWSLLAEVADALPETRFLVASNSAPSSLSALPNVTITPARGPREMQKLYERCAVSFIPLRPNLHASGITVALETARVGRPIVITDTGGISDYFAPSEVALIAPGSHTEAIEHLRLFRSSPAHAGAVTAAATRRIERSHYDSRSFAERLIRAAGELT